MDWSQWLFAGALLLALAGRNWFPWAIVAGNMVATMALAGNPLDVAIVDIGCAAILLTGDRRAKAVALLFVAMQPVYLVSWAFDLSDVTTYTCIDVLAFLQLGVIGGLGGGIGRARRFVAGRLLFSGNSVSFRHNAGPGMARNSEADQG